MSKSVSMPDEGRMQALIDAAHKEWKSHFRRMVNQDEGADVVFVCSDGQQVKATRALLVGRSEVLKGMLTNGMRETSLSEINLPNISSQALLCVFEFLYTSSVSLYLPTPWRPQFEVVEAAQFFLLPILVGIVLLLILDNIEELAEDLPEAAAMLTVILEFKVRHSYHEIECDAIIMKLVRFLSSNWTNSVYAAHLSEEALHYLLSHTKASNQRDGLRNGASCLTEYHRFRQVVLWWASQNVPGWNRQAEEVIESAVPTVRDTSDLYFYGGLNDETTRMHSSLSLNSLLANNASRASAMRLFSVIDLRNIHLLLLEKVIEPLNCFSSAEIMRIFRFHAFKKLGKSVSFNNAIYGWQHGSFMTISGNGSSIGKCNCNTASAIALMRLSSKDRIHLWRFIIEQVENSFIELGFVFSNADQVFGWDESQLDNTSLGSLPNSRVLGRSYVYRNTHINCQGKRYDKMKPLNKPIGIGSFVAFQLDFVEHTCSLNVDGQDFGICWENLPDGHYYPAVCLGQSPRPNAGLIRLQTPNMEVLEC